ncbi:MAG TPA: hypothetical protein VGA47_02745 [Candidatus Dormibacteraeota bacterium]
MTIGRSGIEEPSPDEWSGTELITSATSETTVAGPGRGDGVGAGGGLGAGAW